MEFEICQNLLNTISDLETALISICFRNNGLNEQERLRAKDGLEAQLESLREEAEEMIRRMALGIKPTLRIEITSITFWGPNEKNGGGVRFDYCSKVGKGCVTYTARR